MRPAIQEVLKTLEDAGYEAYIVGGYVRDFLLGLVTKDCDITTNATPDQVQLLFEQVVTIGKIHGTIGVILEDQMIEVTTYRIDGNYNNHRHPQMVTYTASLEEDLARRDFTINAMAMASDGTIIDLYEGQADLNSKLIRAVGDPDWRLQEDALRILRAIRFQSVLGFRLEEKLLLAMRKHASLVAQLSKERVLEELRKFLTGEFFELALPSYQVLSIPGLPQQFIAGKDLTVVEQFAIPSMQKGYDPSSLPWTKEEKYLLGQLVTMAPTEPTDTELYYMSNVQSKLRVGALVYGWNESRLTKRWQDLPIHQRKDVAMNGHDIVELGFQGPQVDEVFSKIEEAIIKGQLVNTKERIKEWIKEILDEHN
jgi:tRNA nucleotidyltransferase (CCA-adding enzyme)